MPDKSELQAMINAAWKMEPKNAIDFFKKKQVKAVLTAKEAQKRPKGVFGHWDWTDTMREQHDRVFVVSKATSIALVKDIKKSIQAAIKNGTSYQDFANDIIPTLKKRGWWGDVNAVNPETGELKPIVVDHLRLRTIYGTNMKTAYDAGKYKEMMEEADIAPYWRFVAIPKGPLNPHPRESHAALHNMVLRYDDPFWEVFFGHKGWNCHCSTKSYTKQGIKKLYGKPADEVVQKSKPENFVSKTETIQGKQITTRGYKVGGKEIYPDAGWDYAPGAYSYRHQEYLNQTINMIDGKDAKYELTKQQKQEIQKNFKEMVKIDASVDRVESQYKSMVAAGILEGAVETFCQKNFSQLKSPIITFDQMRIRHTLREAEKHTGLTKETLEKVPELLDEYTPAYKIDSNNGQVFFFSKPYEIVENGTKKRKRNKIVIGFDERTKTMTYKTGYVVDDRDYYENHKPIKK